MKTALKMLACKSFLYDVIRPFKQTLGLFLWNFHGRPVPPPSLVKQQIVIEHGKRYQLTTLVETGTYLGDMVYACRNVFSRIVSVELNQNLCEIAKRRFFKFKNISFHCGDSSTVLPGLLASIHAPSLFWLDAHYSGGITQRGEVESPIIRELGLILRHPIAGHVVLIDDARNFTGKNSYLTMEALRDLVSSLKPSWMLEVDNDVIRLHERA